MKTLKQINIALASIIIPPFFVACNHKDLCYEHNHHIETDVVFDWRNDPDATPSSMAAVMFDRHMEKDPVRFIFSGRDGGQINLPIGDYDVLGLNADLNDWALFRNQPDIESVELYTKDATQLEAYNLMPASVPRVRGSSLLYTTDAADD
ncbi:MAG: DUF5119 domain-containing protein [Muribaculaceae bacterium]|nr:DUF5119 domain-containing protein [Muribaculaceae bacterium]